MTTQTFLSALFIAAVVAAPLAAASEVVQPPGERFEIRLEDLPGPFATRSAINPPKAIPMPAGASLRVPPGFAVNVFAEGLDDARWLAVAANGDVFLAQSDAGRVTLLRDADGDGAADLVAPFAAGLARPHGLAVRPGWLYVADTEGVWRYAYEPGETRSPGKAERVTAPGALGGGSGHWTRNIAFSPDGARFFVAIGSRSNIAKESPPRATVQEFAADGTHLGTFASGLRNPVGISFYPGTGDLYVVVNERDTLGDGLVPDYLTRLERDGFYGWPYSYLGPNPQPGLAGERPDLAGKAIVPDLLFQSHSAPLGLVFYDGDRFPEEFRGDAFVALHGSWNAGIPTGYKVVRVPFGADKRPKGHYETFASGFWARGQGRARVWGRPVGLAVAADGSLLVADDAGGRVWRVSYGD
ncbi:MAG: PQQ-dependent sugar dehydrogenase [Alphaproteobacteria bacterium]